ncbi:MAG TPA: hypothetical protein VGF98_01070 [Candidatus Tumulicola sp.]|jgi:hypothetical protein
MKTSAKSIAQRQFEVASSPDPATIEKMSRKATRQDRAVVALEVETLRSATSTDAQRAAARKSIAMRVMRPLHRTADPEGTRIISELAEGLHGGAEIELLGLKTAINNVAQRKGISAADVAAIPPAIVERLDKLA